MHLYITKCFIFVQSVSTYSKCGRVRYLMFSHCEHFASHHMNQVPRMLHVRYVSLLLQLGGTRKRVLKNVYSGPSFEPQLHCQQLCDLGLLTSSLSGSATLSIKQVKIHGALRGLKKIIIRNAIRTVPSISRHCISDCNCYYALSASGKYHFTF